MYFVLALFTKEIDSYMRTFWRLGISSVRWEICFPASEMQQIKEVKTQNLLKVEDIIFLLSGIQDDIFPEIIKI